MIVKDEDNYYRLMKETYFEKYYEQIEEFTFKSVIVPLTLKDIKTIYDATVEFENSMETELDMSQLVPKIDQGIVEIDHQKTLSFIFPLFLMHTHNTYSNFKTKTTYFPNCTPGTRRPHLYCPSQQAWLLVSF